MSSSGGKQAGEIGEREKLKERAPESADVPRAEAADKSHLHARSLSGDLAARAYAALAKDKLGVKSAKRKVAVSGKHTGEVSQQ